MGFTNGLRTTNSISERGEKGAKGEGFKLTEDDHFHLENKRLTNVAAPVADNDVVTKKYLTNSLKTKAATNYVINELAKKANSSVLNNYVLKTDLPSSDALDDYYTKSAVDSALSVKINSSALNDYYTKSAVDSAFNDYYTKSEIDSKNGFLFFNTLRHNNDNVVKWNINDCDTSTNYNTFSVSPIGNFSPFKVLKTGYYEITFVDSFNNSGRIETHIQGELIARHPLKLYGSVEWLPFFYQVVLKLNANDSFKINGTGNTIFDGYKYSNFTIKKIS